MLALLQRVKPTGSLLRPASKLNQEPCSVFEACISWTVATQTSFSPPSYQTHFSFCRFSICSVRTLSSCCMATCCCSVTSTSMASSLLSISSGTSDTEGSRPAADDVGLGKVPRRMRPLPCRHSSTNEEHSFWIYLRLQQKLATHYDMPYNEQTISIGDWQRQTGSIYKLKDTGVSLGFSKISLTHRC